MKGHIQRLRAEIASDMQAFAARIEELARLASGVEASPPMQAQVAVALHHAYGAVEAALARIARTLEGGLPQGADWHQALLHSMTLNIDSVRPAVLSPATVGLLRRLLAFRHFFRHAYAVGWDFEQLDSLRRDALAVKKPLCEDLNRLDAFLVALAESMQKSD